MREHAWSGGCGIPVRGHDVMGGGHAIHQVQEVSWGVARGALVIDVESTGVYLQIEGHYV